MAADRLSPSPQQAGGTALFIGTDETAMAVFSAAGHITGVNFLRVPTAAEAFEVFLETTPSLIVVDCVNLDLPSDVVVQQFRLASDTIGIIGLIADSNVSVARPALLRGADEIISKSSDIERIRFTLGALLERVRRRRQTAPAIAADRERINFIRTFRSVFRRGPKSRELEEAVLRLSNSDSPVLLRGEGGVGKKTIGRALHYLSRRSGAPCAIVSCSGLPPDLLDVELFGVELSGDMLRQGQVEFARGGTVILDEFTELPLTAQVKIADLLHQRRLRRVGGQTAIDVDVRIIATTSKESEPLLSAGRLRLDLNAALEQLLFVPPLRERVDDIPGLAEFFRLGFMEYYRHDAPPLSTGLIELMKKYHWPGNVLELQNVVKRCVVLANEASIAAELHARSQSATVAVRKPPARLTASAVNLHDIGRKAADEAQIAVILQVLKDVHWNRAEAARALNVSYKTLLNKLSRAGVVNPAKRALRPQP